MHGIAVRVVVPTAFSETTAAADLVNLVISVSCPEFMKSPIRNLTIHSTGIKPASLRRRVRIEFGHVWLDVEQGRVVEDVYVENVEDASFAPHQPDSGHADRIRPARRTSREQTAFPSVTIRHHTRLESG